MANQRRSFATDLGEGDSLVMGEGDERVVVTIEYKSGRRARIRCDVKDETEIVFVKHRAALIEPLVTEPNQTVST